MHLCRIILTESVNPTLFKGETISGPQKVPRSAGPHGNKLCVKVGDGLSI